MDAPFKLPVDWARSLIDPLGQGYFQDVSRPSSAEGMLVNGVDRDTGYESFQLAQSAVIVREFLRLAVESPNFYTVLVDSDKAIWIVIKKS
jgi:hypothetical protein